jgi:hypothetical protein
MSRRQSGSFFSRIEGSIMAKIIVYLGELERNALASREMRAHATPVIRQELARLGMLSIPAKSLNAEQSDPQVLENQA